MLFVDVRIVLLIGDLVNVVIEVMLKVVLVWVLICWMGDMEVINMGVRLMLVFELMLNSMVNVMMVVLFEEGNYIVRMRMLVKVVMIIMMLKWLSLFVMVLGIVWLMMLGNVGIL